MIRLLLILAVLANAGNLYYLPYGAEVPAGVKYRVLAENGDAPLVIETDKPIDGLTAHAPTWSSGIAVVDKGILAEWRENKPAPVVPDTQLAAKALIVRATLSMSPKLKEYPEIAAQLELLSDAVMYAAKVGVTLTDVSSKGIAEILEHPTIKQNPALWEALENARKTIVGITDGKLE